MKKIIYISYLPLTIKIEQDFYIKDVIEAGVTIEYWDISKLYFNMTLADTVQRNYISHINSHEELENKLKHENIPDTYLIMNMTYEWHVFKLYKLLSLHNCKMIFFARGLLPIYYNPILKSILLKLKEIYNIKMIYRFLKDFILNKLSAIAQKRGIIKNYDTVFAAGNVAINSYKSSSRIIECNQLDYDNYLVIKKLPQRIQEGKYCVFLDEYLPYHPDFSMSKMKTIEPIEYFRALNAFFNYIEKTFNIPVVIAAHPKSDYKSDVFNGRTIYKYKTNELVKDCEFAIAHVSTSVSYAVLYQKPLLFTYTEGMNKADKRYIEYINRFANTLLSPIYNLDDLMRKDFNSFDASHIAAKSINMDKYNEYKYNYLTSKNSENMHTKDIFIDFLKKSN